MITLGDAVLYLRGDSDDLDRHLNRSQGNVKNWATSIGGMVQNAISFATGQLLVNGIQAIGSAAINVARESIASASNLNEALNATSVVFGSASGIIQAFGKTAADAAGLSESAFNQMAAQTGAMLQNYGLGADAAATATVDLATRAADMASIFNTDVSDAMTAINAALRGEADPIERFGVSMNAAAVEAKALAMGYEKVNGVFDTAALTQARLALFMEQTQDIAGDFANTSADLANASRVNAARWENFMSTVGTLGLPIMETMQGLLMNIGDRIFPLLEGAIDNALPSIETFASGFATFVDGVVSKAIPAIQAFLPQILHLGTAIWEIIAPYITWASENLKLQDVLAAVGAIIVGAIIPTLITVGQVVLPIIAIFAGLVAGIALLRKAWEDDFGGIRTAATALWENKLQPMLQALSKWFTVNLPPTLEKFRKIWEEDLQPAIEKFGEIIEKYIIPVVFDQLGIKLGDTDGMLGVLDTTLQIVIGTFELFAKGINAVANAFEWVFQKAAEFQTTLNNLNLPAWLTPGSPTPFEIGLNGIASATGNVSAEIRKMQLEIQTDLSDRLDGALGGRIVERNEQHFNSLTINSSAPIEPIQQDYRMLQAMSGA